MREIIENKTFDQERALYNSNSPLSGYIYVPCVDEIIRDDMDSQGEIIVQCQCHCA